MRSEASGPYWAGCVIGNVILINAHVLDHLDEDGRAQEVFSSTIGYVHKVKSTYSDMRFEIVVGVDTNVTLPGRYTDITGEADLSPANSHTAAMAHVVFGWFSALEVRAMNSFSENADEMNAAPLLWTCGRKRRLAKRTQIDYLAVSSGVAGSARPIDFHKKVLKRSDHRLVHGNLSIESSTLSYTPYAPSLRGWSPISVDDAVRFKESTAGLQSANLHAMQKQILDAAQVIHFSMAGDRSQAFRATNNRRIKDARLAVSQADAEARPKAALALRKALKQARRLNNENKLKYSTRKRGPTRLATALRVDGKVTDDRQRWLT